MDGIVCHIVIVGCGLGRLAAAIALRRHGHDVTMLEQAAQLSQVQATLLPCHIPVLQPLKIKLLLSRPAPAFKYHQTPRPPPGS